MLSCPQSAHLRVRHIPRLDAYFVIVFVWKPSVTPALHGTGLATADYMSIQPGKDQRPCRGTVRPF